MGTGIQHEVYKKCCNGGRIIVDLQEDPLFLKIVSIV